MTHTCAQKMLRGAQLYASQSPTQVASEQRIMIIFSGNHIDLFLRMPWNDVNNKTSSVRYQSLNISFKTCVYSAFKNPVLQIEAPYTLGTNSKSDVRQS